MPDLPSGTVTFLFTDVVASGVPIDVTACIPGLL
jgi:hypothetical protein